MAIYSFMRKGIDLEKIEIDISLVPGLPAFHLIGLPDASIKESILRVKSALRHQGYRLPQKDQVIINLKPAYEKKSSQGLDLAIAAAYLIQTGQLEQATVSDARDLYFYGELTLNGEVRTPADLQLLEDSPANSKIITGETENKLGFFHGCVKTLADLINVRWQEGLWQSDDSPSALIDKFKDFEFSEKAAETMTIVASGEHNTFIAGPAGTGKTTFTEAVHTLLRTAILPEKKKIAKIAKITGKEVVGRPFISPHHSSTEIALLGGGIPPQPGEITRAQHGMLVLDEFLEFSSYVKESLREPIEKHEITINRAANKVTFPADFLLVATSNLCPCGEYVPNCETKCGFYSSYCKSYYKKLSGPLMDRFEIITFSHDWKSKEKTSVYNMKEKVMRAQDFALRTRGQNKMNSRLTLAECEQLVTPFVRKNLLPEVPQSHRRMLAFLRVARTIADLECSEAITGQHLNRAKSLTIQPFRELKTAWY